MVEIVEEEENLKAEVSDNCQLADSTVTIWILVGYLDAIYQLVHKKKIFIVPAA